MAEKITVGIIEELLDRQPSGDTRSFARLSGFADAGPDAIVFAQDEASLAQALRSAAGLILARVSGDNLIDPRLFPVRNPKYVFALCGRWFDSFREPSVHPSAVIDPEASVGPGTSVGAGAVIAAGARLGRGCVIGSNVTIFGCATLGDRVVAQAGAVLGSVGFGYVPGPDGHHLRFPQQGTLWIGDDVEIGANTTIDRGALGETRIGRGTKIDNLVHIAHNCIIGEDVLIAAQVGLAGSIIVEDRAMLGGQVGLGERVTIGRGVILGGQGGVLPGKKIEGDGTVYWGTPAQPVREYLRDLARLRRR
ncbi:UDP-3-O-(3-hydroxymyristoyl)glucosamine N-acyltransferase [Granulicella sp. WH15]|uniref:UDP-3-O-(3-hydroxymyristoyl)glucosamine N-acyltransferase n=1 Tax=Granulicella sp. WH15 TaxID=2602070 RepID=UPI001366FE0B|nr:UDP-3-O-(3-hydroxymyristoyl)glucosamine N-acyltransferase [Granulicella sp. WH15]QHN04234.1 UDP-3-O-(3-hydroxymyristoyl)glucosamine N-acyltransferase [Granulicella sp. WH15]